MMILDSLLSVFLVIVAGWLLKRHLVPLQEHWQGLEKLTYFVLVPALILKTLASTALNSVPFVTIGGTLLVANLVGCAILLALRPLLAARFGVDGPAFTSVFQGAMRWNAFIALALSGNIFGAQGLALAAVAIATLIPIINIEAVLVLKRYGTGGGGSLTRGLLTNPFLIATMLGILINASGLPLPRFAMMTLDILGNSALATGLLLVGVGLRLNDLKSPGFALVLGVCFRLIIMPVIAACIGMLFGLSGTALAVIVIATGVPAAAAAYILARQMGGDAPLMAAILTAQTLVSAITLPIFLFVFGR
jgi:malonate transporter and related proteins